MTIPARTSRAGTWWHKDYITITREREGKRNKIRLTIGEDLRIEVTQKQAVQLINDIADILEN